MPRFVVFASRIPSVCLSAEGKLSSARGRAVYGHAIAETDNNQGSIRLSACDPGLRPLAAWLNASRHNDSQNALLAPSHILGALKPELEGDWDFPAESPCAVGPTSLFAVVVGFLDEVLSVHQRGSVSDVGTLAQWNHAFDDLAPRIFALHYAHHGRRPSVPDVIRAFEQALSAANI
jgi:hypothetical protein